MEIYLDKVPVKRWTHICIGGSEW